MAAYGNHQLTEHLNTSLESHVAVFCNWLVSISIITWITMTRDVSLHCTFAEAIWKSHHLALNYLTTINKQEYSSLVMIPESIICHQFSFLFRTSFLENVFPGFLYLE